MDSADKPHGERRKFVAQCSEECEALLKMENRLGAVESSVQDVSRRVASMEPKLDLALKGVSNFRIYQEESRENWAELKAERQVRKELEIAAEKKKWKRSDKIAALALGSILFAIPVERFWVFSGDMMEMHDDWKKFKTAPEILPAPMSPSSETSPSSIPPIANEHKSFFHKPHSVVESNQPPTQIADK